MLPGYQPGRGAVPGVPPLHTATSSARLWYRSWSPSSSRCHVISQAMVPSLESLLFTLPRHQPGCGTVPGVPPHAARLSARPWCRPWSPSSSRCQAISQAVVPSLESLLLTRCHAISQAVVPSLESLFLTLPCYQPGRGAVPGVPLHAARPSARPWCHLWNPSSSRCHAISQAVVSSLESPLLTLPGYEPGWDVRKIVARHHYDHGYVLIAAIFYRGQR